MEKLKILIVDDEENILSAIARELTFFLEEKDLALLSATSAVKALEYLERESQEIAVIISDQKMPGMSGSSFLLKVRDLYPDIVSIILTAHADLEEIAKVIKAGIFSFITKPWDKRYLLAEVEKALNVYILRKENKKYLRMLEQELQWGGELQQTLLKREIPRSSFVDFTVTYMPLPALHCSGDYYDIIPLDEGLYLVLIGDVAGHGIKGALVTAILKSIIYSGYVSKHKHAGFSPADFLCWLNRQICLELKHMPDTIITFAACFINLKEKNLLYAKAGHLPMILVRGEQAKQIDAPGSAMGFSPEFEYRNTSFTIDSSDKLFFFTDGLVENNSESVESIFLNWQTLFITKARGQALHAEVLQRAQNTFPANKFKDDVTLMSIEIK